MASVIWALLVFAMPAIAQSNIVQDGGFESCTASVQSQQNLGSPSYPPDWQQIGRTGTFTGCGDENDDLNEQPFDGNWMALLGSTGQDSGFQQTLTTLPAATYTVSYAWAYAYYGGSDKDSIASCRFSVSIGGVDISPPANVQADAISTADDTTNVYTVEQVSLTASSTSTVLSFQGQYNYWELDSFSVTEDIAPTRSALRYHFIDRRSRVHRRSRRSMQRSRRARIAAAAFDSSSH